MAKVLRAHKVKPEDLTQKVQEEILFLTRGVVCPECVEILFESDLYRRLLRWAGHNGGLLSLRDKDNLPRTVMRFNYRVAYGPGVGSGSMAVLIRSEVVFK